MGCFSWKDCVTKEQIRIGFYGKYSYVLVPEEFGGGHIAECCYEGYGEFGGYDIYELVALWNRKYLKTSIHRAPKKERYCGLWPFEERQLREEGKSEEEIAALDDEKREAHYQEALKRYERKKELFKRFITSDKDDESIAEEFGNDLREIGIDIACENKDNKKLKYPIKITYDEDAVYENCSYSLSDPNQGL